MLTSWDRGGGFFFVSLQSSVCMHMGSFNSSSSICLSNIIICPSKIVLSVFWLVGIDDRHHDDNDDDDDVCTFDIGKVHSPVHIYIVAHPTHFAFCWNFKFS